MRLTGLTLVNVRHVSMIMFFDTLSICISANSSFDSGVSGFKADISTRFQPTFCISPV